MVLTFLHLLHFFQLLQDGRAHLVSFDLLDHLLQSLLNARLVLHYTAIQALKLSIDLALEFGKLRLDLSDQNFVLLCKFYRPLITLSDASLLSSTSS